MKIFITMALGIVMLSSCSESFLDSEPITELTDVNFYRTTDDAELAIIGCYDGLQVLYSNGQGIPVIAEVLSDDCFGGTGNSDAYNYQMLDEFDLSRSPGDIDLLNNNWQAYYKGLYRCNVLLQKIDQIDWEGNTAYKNSIEAQARFLRAYFYFDMVRVWENVPLLTEPSDENIPQANPDSVYRVIANDLLFAAENGAEEVQPGRINKWAAKAFLARVYLFYTGYYNKTDLVGVVMKSQALQGLEDVIASQNYGLIEEFKNLWPAASSFVESVENNTLGTTFAGYDNTETVFAIKYNITSDYDGNTDGNHWMVMFGPRTQTFPPYGRGWGACTVLPSFYDSFEDGDTRRDASIIAYDEEELDFDISDQREYTGYSTKKYIPLALPDGTDLAESNNATNFMIGQYQDYVVIRYADVLLMAAELGSANSQDYFDMVRERAGLESKTANQANIMAERHFEFAFEGLRYWDLLRQGVQTAADEIAVSTTVLNGGVEENKVINAAKVVEKDGLLMIPQTQISLSDGVLKQNEGWK